MAMEEDFRRLASGFIDGASIAGMDPQRLSMGPITSNPSDLVPNPKAIPLWQDLQRFDSGPITQRQPDLMAEIAKFLAQEKAPEGVFDLASVLAELAATVTLGELPPKYDPQATADFFSNATVNPFLKQQNRADKLAQEYGAQGFTFSIDPKTGTTFISNTPETRAQAGLTTAGPVQSQGPANVRATLEAIRKEADPVARASLFADLQAQTASFEAGIVADVTKQAEAKLGIPQLEATLKQNEAQDKADPKWNQFQSDSPITASVRQQLLRARAQADNEAAQALKGNTTIAAMKAQLGAAATIFNRQEKLNDMRDTAKINKDYNAELEDKALVEQTSPEMIERMAVIDPSFQSKSAVEVARYVNKGVRDTNTKEALTAQPEALPMLAAIKGNEAAAKILIAKQKEAGLSEAEAEIQLKQVRSIMTNDAALKKAAAMVYAGNKEALASFNAGLAMQMTGTGTKQQAEEMKLKRFDIAQSLLRMQVEKNFLDDVNTWGIADPELSASVAKAKETHGNASASEVLSAFIGDRVGFERQQRIKQFKQMMQTAAAPKAKNLLAAVDPDIMWQRVISHVNLNQVNTAMQAAPVSGGAIRQPMFLMGF